MNKNWTKFRLIIFVAILIGAFVVRRIYPSFKTTNHPSETTQQTTPRLNRNITNIIFTKHARCRMECRDITEDEIKEILHDGNINYNKSELNNDRRATYALEGYSHEQQHLRIIFAPEKDKLVVVTCIDMDKEWHCDCN